MKHAVKQRKPSVEPKTKSLAPTKAVTKTKSLAKKSAVKVTSKSHSTKPIQKTKAVAEIAPKTGKVSTKTSLKKNAPTSSTKTLNALKTVSTRKIKPIVEEIEKPKAKKIASKLPAKSAKATSKKVQSVAPKIKPISKAQKVVVEKKITKPTAKQTATVKTKKISTKIVKPLVQKVKPKTIKVAAKKVQPKTVRPTIQKAKKPNSPTAKVVLTDKKKIVSQPMKPIAKAKKASKIEETKLTTAKNLKSPKTIAPTIKAETVKQKAAKTLIVTPKKSNKKLITAEPIIEPKKSAAKKVSARPAKAKVIIESKEIEVEIPRFEPISATENVVWKRLKFKPAISSAKAAKARQKIKKQADAETVKPIAATVEIKVQTPKPKRGKPIGSAVFRGKKERYDFKVFELDEKFEPIPAVYIISKRKTDRHKRGHHAVVCIGQTNSVLDELKRHRKGKCVKKHQANVVSILPETDEKMRLRIETDLKAAHTVACNFD